MEIVEIVAFLLTRHFRCNTCYFSPLSRTTTLTWTATSTYPRTFPVRLGDLSTPLWSWNSRRYAAKMTVFLEMARSLRSVSYDNRLGGIGSKGKGKDRPRHETEFEAPGIYAVSAPRLENALPRCEFPGDWHSQTLSLGTRRPERVTALA